MTIDRINISKAKRPVQAVAIHTVAKLVKATGLKIVDLLDELDNPDDFGRLAYHPFFKYAEQAIGGQIELAKSKINREYDKYAQTKSLQSKRQHSLDSLEWLDFEFKRRKWKISKTLLGGAVTRIIAPNIAGLPLKGGFQWVASDDEGKEYLVYCWMGKHTKADIPYLVELLHVMAEGEFGPGHPSIVYCDPLYTKFEIVSDSKPLIRSSLEKIVRANFDI